MLILLLATLPTTIELFIWVIGLYLAKKNTLKNRSEFPLAIVVPAYNEEKGILETLTSLKKLDRPIFVIADHCTDKTVEISLKAGVSVIERNEGLAGKPYAVEYAFAQLRHLKFTHFLIIDADSVVSPNLVEEIEKGFSAGYDFVQVHYTTIRSDPLSRLYYLKLESINHARPLAKQGLQLRPGCFGNGFAISDEALKGIRLKGLVEDQGLYYDLALKNKKALFLDHASVLSVAPPNIQAHITQNKRWEGGRIELLKEYFIPLLKKGLWESALTLLTLPVLYYFISLIVLLFFFPTYALISLTFLSIHYLQTFILAKGTWEDLLSIFQLPKLIWIKALSFSRMWSRSSWTRTPR